MFSIAARIVLFCERDWEICLVLDLSMPGGELEGSENRWKSHNPAGPKAIITGQIRSHHA